MREADRKNNRKQGILLGASQLLCVSINTGALAGDGTPSGAPRSFKGCLV
jgi:hypothetical protein